MDSAPQQTQPEFEALAARVAELERIVAELRAAREVVLRPVRREAPPPAPPPMPTPPPPPLLTAAPRKSFEDRLGTQIFPLIAILALILGTAYGLKLAIEHGLIGPVARVLLGLIAGAALVLWSEVFRRKAMAAFSYSLKAIGSGVLYLSLWAAFQLYHLLPASIALIAMILVTAWNAWMALSQDAELLAGYALAGGLLTPLLLSTGGNHEAFLFTYLGAIDLGIIYLLRTKPWRWLLAPTFAGTVIYFAGWFGEFFHAGYIDVWNPQSTETAAFALLFFVLFALITIRGWVTLPEPEKPGSVAALEPVLLPLVNAAFLAVSLYQVMHHSGLEDARAWLMVALAALLLGLMRLQRTRLAAAMQLAAAVVCLTIAVPLKASGHTLTTAWLVEGVVLYWAGTRFEEENGVSSKMLWALSFGGYTLGLASLVAHWWWFDAVRMGFLNRNLGAALVAIVTLAGAAFLASRRADPRSRVLWLSLIAIDAVAVLLAMGEIASTWEYGPHPAFANPEFYTAVVGLAVLASAAWAAFRLDSAKFAAATTVVFHLVAILSVEREIGALWTRTDANLQRSLAISGFLMLYGAGLLATGFVRRNAFVRWQGLTLLVFTIGKVFLYDMSSLNAGYRVASIMGLGAVLLAVSYAYQKDWLGLKTPHDEAPQ